MKKFLMKILSDESRILRLSPNLWYGIKDIKLSIMLQGEQIGVLIIKLNGSILAKLRNHDQVTTPTHEYSKNPLIRNHISRNHRLFFL